MNQFIKKLVSGLSTVAIIAGSVLYVNGMQSQNAVVNEEEITYVEDNEISQEETKVEFPITPIGLIRVNASALNVRETPNGKVMGALKKDTIQYVYGFSGNWLQVILDGQHGFVYSKYTDIYDFNHNKQGMNDVQTVFGTKEALASKELSEADIAVLNNYETIHRNELEAVINVTPVPQSTVVSPDQVAEDPAAALARQQAEAQAALLAQQQAALEQAAELARQQAEAQAALLAEQQKAAQAALNAQLAEEAKRQALLAKDPNTLNTPELCQYVLAQIITPGMDDFAKATAVNNWLCDHMTYDLNYYTTRDAILLGRGRCQGYSNAYKNLMNAAGVPTDIITGYGNGGKHGWNRVLINGAYYYVDVTWNDTTGNYSKYLLISEEQMNRDHQPMKLNPRTE